MLPHCDILCLQVYDAFNRCEDAQTGDVDALGGLEDEALCPLSVSGRLHEKLWEALGTDAVDGDQFFVHQTDVLRAYSHRSATGGRPGGGRRFPDRFRLPVVSR